MIIIKKLNKKIGDCEMKRRIMCIGITFIFIIGCFGAVSTTGLKVNIDNEKINNNLNIINIENTNCVIVVGAAKTPNLYDSYTGVISYYYNSLRDNYGFSDEQIDFLFEFQDFPPRETFDPSVVDYRATKSNLQTVLNQFKPGGSKEMNDNDMLFLVWIGHGGGENPTSFVLTSSDSVIDYEFAEYIENIKGLLVFLFQPCHSGGFIEEVGAPGRIVMSSVNSYESEGGFFKQFVDALNGDGDVHTNFGNNDGITSFEEAHVVASDYLYRVFDKHSLIDDNGDGVGSHYKSSDYDINDPSKDGFLASQTSLGKIQLRAEAGGPYNAKPGEVVQFQGRAIGGIPAYTYLWDFGDGETSNEQNPQHIYDNKGEYTAKLTINDAAGESATDNATVIIKKGRAIDRIKNTAFLNDILEPFKKQSFFRLFLSEYLIKFNL